MLVWRSLCNIYIYIICNVYPVGFGAYPVGFGAYPVGFGAYPVGFGAYPVGLIGWA